MKYEVIIIYEVETVQKSLAQRIALYLFSLTDLRYKPTMTIKGKDKKL